MNADNSLLTFAILVFVYFFLCFEKCKDQQYIFSRVVLAILLGICLWVKELTPLFILIGIILYRAINQEWKKLFWESILIVIGGIVIFWGSWWAYCAITGTDLLGFIKFTIINKAHSAFGKQYLAGMLKNILATFRWPFLWVSITFFLSLLIFSAKRIWGACRTKRVEGIDLLLILGAVIWLPYQFFKPNMDMMKYQYPAYAFLIPCIAYLFAHTLKENGIGESAGKIPTKKIALFFMLAVSLTVYYYSLGDSLLGLPTNTPNHLRGEFRIYYTAPILLCMLLILWSTPKDKWKAYATYACILFTIPINAGLDLNQAKPHYNTAEIWLNYGESGLQEQPHTLQQKYRIMR